MKIKKGILYFSTPLLFSSFSFADIKEFDNAVNALCKKTKVCTSELIEADSNIPPEMKTMMNSFLDEMCSNYARIGEFAENTDLIESATACLNSMATRSCNDLLNADEETDECIQFEKVANKYSDR